MAYTKRQVIKKDNEESHIVLFGPTLVGKGKCVKDIETEFSNRVYTIGIGNKIRKKLQDDDDFRDRFGNMIRAGKLLPKVEVDKIALECYESGRNAGYKCFVWDGYGRTGDQVKEMISRGFLTPERSKFLVLDASVNTCIARLTHAKEHNTRHGRDDDDSLRNRHREHMEKVPNIITYTRLSGIKVIIIDADKDLDRVSEQVRTYARQLFVVDEHRQKIPTESYTPKPPYKSDTDFFHLRGLGAVTSF